MTRNFDKVELRLAGAELMRICDKMAARFEKTDAYMAQLGFFEP